MPIIDVLGVPHVYALTAPTAKSIALVFVHGWLLSREYWQPVIERLSSRYQCLTYDLRGFGESNQTPAPLRSLDRDSGSASKSKTDSSVNCLPQLETSIWKNQRTDVSTLSDPPLLTEAFLSRLSDSLEELDEASLATGAWQSQVSTVSYRTSDYAPVAYAQDLEVLLKQLGIEQAWLVGHSLGGSIALWSAYQMPTRIQGVICINSGGGIYLKEEFERFRSAGQQLLKIRPRWLCHMPLIDLLFTRASVVKAIDRRWGRQRVIDFVMAHPKAALGTLLDSTTEAEVHRLPQVVFRLKQPVYFFAGDQDPIMEPKYVRHLASFHPSFKQCGDNVVEIPDCGHMAMVEQPDFVAEQIKEILASHEI
jgi:2-succinyl-6-hydroxy-2,4-cyclohexadiene-1-carboxylate synthase